MTDLRTAAQQALGALDKSLYMNDYCGLEVSKHDQPDVTDAIEALRTALAERQEPCNPSCAPGYCYCEPAQEPDPWGAGYEAGYAAGVAEYDPQPPQQALTEADRIMGHDDEATEWRNRWAHLFGVAGSATSPWRESAVQDCSPGGTGMPATPPQRPAEPMVWTTQFDINWALNNPGRAGSFYANKEGSNDIALYTAPPQCKENKDE